MRLGVGRVVRAMSGAGPSWLDLGLPVASEGGPVSTSTGVGLHWDEGALADAEALEAMVANSFRAGPAPAIGGSREARGDATASVYSTLSGCSVCGRVGATYYQPGHVQVCLSRDVPVGAGGAKPPAAPHLPVGGAPRGAPDIVAANRANPGTGSGGHLVDPPGHTGVGLPGHMGAGVFAAPPRRGVPLSPLDSDELRASMAWEKETAGLRHEPRNPRAALRGMLL